jgi:hypothetical protein
MFALFAIAFSAKALRVEIAVCTIESNWQNVVKFRRRIFQRSAMTFWRRLFAMLTRPRITFKYHVGIDAFMPDASNAICGSTFGAVLSTDSVL